MTERVNRMYDRVRKGEEATLNIDRKDEIGELAQELVSLRDELKHQEETKEETKAETKVEIKVARKPMVMEMRPPYQIPEKISRPRVSVPNRNSVFGAILKFFKSR